MYREMIAPNDLRTFYRIDPEGRRLARNNASSVLPKGSRVLLGESVVMYYDHKDQLVMPVMVDDEVSCYVIVSELEIGGTVH